MILPPQKLSMAEKLERNNTTGKNNIEETIDFYIESANFHTYTSEIVELYEAVSGNLKQEDYKTVQNPFNKQKDDNAPLQFNAVLKDYNILKGVVNLLMGEFGRRSHEFEVASINPNDEFSYKQGLSIALQNYYSQAVANNLAQLGFNLGQKVEELPSLDDYVANFKQTFEETRVISGQEVLDYIKYNCDLDSKYLDLYWDWVITGGAFTYKKVNHDDVYFEVVPRHELYIPIESHSRYIEDYSFAVRRQILPVYKVLDLFKGRLTEEQLEEFERSTTNGLGINYSNTTFVGRRGAMILPTIYTSEYNTSNNFANMQGLELYHVVYKSFRPYYILTYEDKLGQIKEMEVGEDYVLDKAFGDIKLELQWENIVMQGYKVLDYYLDCGPLLENRADLNQNGLQKLPYNGIVSRSAHGEIQSIVKDGLPYQRLINTLKFQVEKLINKNKDKVLVLPYGLIPRKKGITTKDAMYHMDATSILWIDETSPNAQVAGQMIKTVDMSLGNYIRDITDYARLVKMEYWEAIGMNAQRYSDIAQGAGKGVTEQAIVRSAIITYELTRQFDKLIEKDYQGLLDLSKLAYINGKKSSYIRTDASIGFLTLNADGAKYHSESSYNVFVRDSSLMTEAIQAIRAQATNIIQHTNQGAAIGKLYSTNNITKLTKLLEGLDAIKVKNEQAMQEAQSKNAQALQDKVNENDAENRKLEYYKIDKNYEGVVDSATIRSGDNSRNLPRPSNAIEEKLAEHKISKENKELSIKETLANKKDKNTST